MLRRLQRELLHLTGDGIYAALSGHDLTKLQALIVGPEDTPYDAALLHFELRVPDSYPLEPPEVTFLTTDQGRLRLHPQLYADGNA